MLIYFVECFIMGFALGLSWASFATPVYLILPEMKRTR